MGQAQSLQAAQALRPDSGLVRCDNKPAAAAIQLIRQLDDGKYQVCDEAVEFLRANGTWPVSVVSIAGVARQGKSYLLNRLLGVKGAFKISPLVDPCTHGLWMWPEAVTLQGKKHKLVYIDTEGIASQEQTASASSTMVALAGLISSLLVYNQWRYMDENCIESLGHAARTLDNLFSHTGDLASKGSPVCLAPELLLLVRDADLRSELSPSEQLESDLKDLPLAGADIKGIQAQNNMRHVIRTVFNKRSCNILPRPCVNTNSLPDMPTDVIDPEFEQGVSELRRRVLDSPPKTFNGAVMTGPLLVQLLTAAVAAVNKPGGVLNIGSMWSALLDAELKAAAAAAQDRYQAASKALTTCKSPDEAEQMHKNAMQAARQAFMVSKEFADTANQEAAWQQLEAQLNSSFTTVLSSVERQIAERKAQYSKVVAEAKTEALKALDRQGLLCELQDCTDLNHATHRAQDCGAAAWKVFYDVIASAWVESAPPSMENQLKYAEDEVSAAAVLLTREVKEQVKAAQAAAQAKAAAAEIARLEHELRMASLQQDALADAVKSYSGELKKLLASCDLRTLDAAALRCKHQALVSSLCTTKGALLPEQYAAKLTVALKQQCADLFEDRLSDLLLRKESEDRKLLASAAERAHEGFKAALNSSVSQSATDTDSAKRSIQVATQKALSAFDQLASQQTTYAPRSATYNEVYLRLEKDIRAWSDDVFGRVKRNAAAEDARRKAAAEAAEARRRQQEADAAAAAEQRRRLEEEAAAERQRIMREEQQLLEELDRRLRLQQQQEEELRSMQRQLNNVVNLRRRRVGITREGTVCKNCAKGHSCPHDHAEYIYIYD